MFSEEMPSQAGQKKKKKKKKKKNQQSIGIKSFTQIYLTVLNIKKLHK